MQVAADTNELAGYRLVRKLAAGSRADVYLGAGSTGTVAIKVFKPAVSGDSIGTELEAIGRLDSPHFVRLLDLASTPDDIPILILERVKQGSVAALLRDRDSLERGEVVTLLAPLAGALSGLHRLGVAHGRIVAGSLHVGSRGEPVLIGFGHCELFPREGSIAAIDAEPAAANDRDSMAALAVALLSRVRDAATDRRVLDLIEWIDAAPREYEFSERLEARLFDFADALPVDFARPPTVASVPARIKMTERVASLPHSAPVVEEPLAAMPSSFGVLGRLDALLRDNPLEVAKTRVLGFVRGVRKPFWVAAGAAVIAIVLAVALLPQGAPAPSPGAVPPSASTEPSPTATPLPSDPVQALPRLLADRARCIRDLSVLCLDNVDEQSSSAYTSDAALIEQLQGGTEIPSSATITAPAPVLTEQLGDAALISLGAQPEPGKSKPASILMVRGEAGWRMRGYLSGVQSTGSPSDSD